MSYYGFKPENQEQAIGFAIYMDALSDRRGFRCDQLGIDDAELWREIFEHMGMVALRAVAEKSPPPLHEAQETI